MKFNLKSRSFIDSEIGSDRLAIAGSDLSLTWGELRTLVDELIGRFEELDLQPGTPVFIYDDNSPLQAAAFVACMIKELPVVPVGLQVPFYRIEQMKNVVKAEVLVACCPYAGPNFATVIHWQANLWQFSSRGSKIQPVTILREISYIVFTSGSTGTPKAVPISWKNYMAFRAWYYSTDLPRMRDGIGINALPFYFDGYIILFSEMLENGSGMIILRPKDDPKFIFNFKDEVTTWVSTPSMLQRFLMFPEISSQRLPKLKKFIVGGEVLSHSLCKKIEREFAQSEIWNVYGPTESTVIVSAVKMSRNLISSEKDLPIAIMDQCPHLSLQSALDEFGNPVSEIVVSGDSVANGYLHSSVQSDPKFFRNSRGEWSYRSGDLGLEEDGMLFIAGRKDNEVKLHGNRMNLSEIENLILTNNLAVECVCLGLRRERVIKKIICVLVTDANSPDEFTLRVGKIKEFLAERLPAPMIPSQFYSIEKMPLLNETKIDRAKLLEQFSSPTEK